ncbi:MAG: anhydro-N-acetylmuramic acid kinase [Alphaproteobacteria bacterium]|nr:anhydro-N-acetylmuramic acid kinase [Alphaproteobacteria bacterium]
MNKILKSLGLMSGTSMDGVDAAIIDTDGVNIFETGEAITIPYDDSLKEQLRSVLGEKDSSQLKEIENEMTLFHAEVVKKLLKKAKLSSKQIDVIGFHGHTISHNPKEKHTLQIGDGLLLAKKTGIKVVNRFRNADVEAGGQGAPLVPIYHDALCKDFEKPVAVLNLGGVGNVTFIGSKDDLLAFDTGMGNALIDDFMLQKTGKAIDIDGKTAASGKTDMKIISKLLSNPYFDKKPPKSLDRNDFEQVFEFVKDMSIEDGAATLTAFTTQSVMYAFEKHIPQKPTKCIVCGGGSRNQEIMAQLKKILPFPVETTEIVGWNNDAVEAQAFAFLAVRSLYDLPLTFPKTTGVSIALCGGEVCLS